MYMEDVKLFTKYKNELEKLIKLESSAKGLTLKLKVCNDCNEL